MNRSFMLRAIELARLGAGKTSPNPCVGAVIVKGGCIVAEGWHKKAGEKHAETLAIEFLMRKSGIKTVDIDPLLFLNAELYITLEPCCHFAKTPPCTESIMKAGFKAVYIGMKDPFDKVNGRGVAALKRAGIKVEVLKPESDLAFEVRKLNQPFIKWAKTGLPYVVLKAGMSLDGKIATKTGESKWITSEISRKDARSMRNLYDAVLVGSGTVLSDNPNLGEKLRIVIDSKLACDFSAQIFRDANFFVACSEKATQARRKMFKKAGISYKSFGKDHVSLRSLLKYLGKNGITSLLVEGGGGIHGAFFDEWLVDKILFYVSPILIGGEKSLSVIGGQGVSSLKKALKIREIEVVKIAEDLKISGVVNFY